MNYYFHPGRSFLPTMLVVALALALVLALSVDVAVDVAVAVDAGELAPNAADANNGSDPLKISPLPDWTATNYPTKQMVK